MWELYCSLSICVHLFRFRVSACFAYDKTVINERRVEKSVFEDQSEENSLWILKWTTLLGLFSKISFTPAQARNELETPGMAKSFLRGAQVFVTMSSSFQLCPTDFSRGDENFAGGAKPPLGAPSYRPAPAVTFCYLVHALNGDAHLPAALLCYFRCNWCRNLAAVNCVLHWIVFTLSTLQVGITLVTVRSCITLLWLHHNHKMSISYHKNGLVSNHQSVSRWFIFMCFEVRIFWRN